MTVRPATRADVPDIVDLGERFMRESPYGAYMQPDRAAMVRLAHLLIASDDGVLLVDDAGGVPTGMLGMLASLHPYSGVPVMTEMFWYVSPESRGSGVRLLRAAEKWGTDKGIALAMMTAPDDRVSNFLTRIGYTPVEANFIKDLRQWRSAP